MSGGAGSIYTSYIRPVLTPWSGDRDAFSNILANTTPYSVVDSYQKDAEERATRIAGEERVVAEAAAAEQAKAAAAEAATQQAAKDAAAAEAAAAAKAAADKVAAEEKASQDAATLLATRRRTSSVTPSGAKGVLGQAPVKLKTLLGS
jgi:colicin import membrane protein